jgi:integrase
MGGSGFLTPEQAHRLIAAAKKEWMRSTLIVALATGMREGELRSCSKVQDLLKIATMCVGTTESMLFS